MTRSYTEFIRIPTFEERYRYLREFAEVGIATFGNERWLNQQFYTSREWRDVRQVVIARDLGCDLGVEGREVFRDIIVHHMNPLELRDVRGHDEAILDPEFLISTSLRTHNAIHFGSEDQLAKPMVQRAPGDTKLW
jgi:hypothetical protein